MFSVLLLEKKNNRAEFATFFTPKCSWLPYSQNNFLPEPFRQVYFENVHEIVNYLFK
jgi:hypothetical protein